MTRTTMFSLLKRLLPLPLLALASFAHAGHWVTAYSGGTGTQRGSSSSYSFSNGTYGGGGIDASGTITATLSWVADHPGDNSTPPAEVYVLESCGAGGTSDNGGSYTSSPSADADNGLGSGTVRTTQQLYGTYVQYTATSQGVRVSKHSTSGAITVTATPHAAGGISAAVNYAASVTPYAAGISSDRDVTYYVGDAHARHPNDLSFLTPRFGDTAASFDPNAADPYPGHGDRYVCTPTFSVIAPGFTNPIYQWAGDGVSGSGTSVTPSGWTYSVDDVSGWVQSGGPTKSINLIVTDPNTNVTATAVYHMKLHAPEETIIGTRGATDLTTAYVDSSSVTIPFGGVSDTHAREFSSKVTVTAGVSGGANFSPAGLKWISANLGFSVSGSAEISYKQSDSYTFTACPTTGCKRTWWIRRRGRYDHCTIDYDTYDVNGYAGHVTAQGTTFHSADAATAAANDYDDEEMWTDAPV